MHSHDTTPPRVHFLRAAAIIVLLLLFVDATDAQTRYTVSCGEDVHASIAAAGNPQTVTFEPGCVYRLTRRIDPANGQTFEGNGATLNGSKLLPDNLWIPQGAIWYVTGQTQQGTRKSVAGETMCESGSPRCNYPENLYRDGLPLKHVDDLSKLVAGAWYFDYTADRIYVYDNPVGRTMETSYTTLGQTNCAICGGANDVTVRGFTVTMFGTTTENATIEGFTPGGQRWLIEGNTIQYNGAIGAVVRAGGILRGNTLLNNGQSGYGAGGTISVKAAGIVIEDNEVGYNNFKRVNPHFSSGGGKASWTVGLIFRRNYVHHNIQRGTWFDLDNSNTVIERNRIEYNDTGLFLEMGGSAVVRDNAFRCNGAGADGTFQTSVLITNASNIVIEDNDIVVCAEGNGIGVREDGNPTRLINGTRRHTDNIDVIGNRITFLACSGAVGKDAYGEDGELGRVDFQRNIYTTKCGDYPHWIIELVKLRWPEWVIRYPSEVLVSGEPIPQPTAAATPSATPPEFATPTVEFATMTATPVETPAPLSVRRFVIEIIIKEFAP